VYRHLNIKKLILLCTECTSIYVFLLIPRIRSNSFSKERIVNRLVFVMDRIVFSVRKKEFC